MLALVPLLCTLSPQLDLQAGLAEDFKVLKSAYEQLHPGLYRYNTPKQMEAKFEVLRKRFAKAKDLKEAYVDLSLFTASVRCGHTYPNFFNQNKDVIEKLFKGQNRVPFHFRWLDGQIIVTQDLTAGHLLPAGTEIRAIDGIPTATIKTKLMAIARADGSNDAKRFSILGVDGKSKYEAFDIYLPLMFPIPEGSFQLSIRTVEGHQQTIRVPALSMEDRIADCKAQEEAVSKDGSKWRFEFKTPTIGLLTMPTFVMYDGKWDWQGYLSRVFTQLSAAKASSLIIDLRGNEGGSAIGEELCAYLIDRPTKFDQYKLYTRYIKVPPDLRPNLDTWDRSFDDWSQWCEPAMFIEAGKNSFHRMKRFDDVDRSIIQPKSPHFTGNVFILVDSSNSSATFEFDNMIQTHHLGRLVGEPTGGSKRGINGSAFYFLYLPNSKLEVDLPLVAQFPDMNMPDEGLTPEVLVHPSAESIAAGRDEILVRAFQLAHTPS
jgi:hypothetical protein